MLKAFPNWYKPSTRCVRTYARKSQVETKNVSADPSRTPVIKEKSDLVATVVSTENNGVDLEPGSLVEQKKQEVELPKTRVVKQPKEEEEEAPPVESARIEPLTKKNEALLLESQKPTSIEPLPKEEEETTPVQSQELTSIEPLPKEEEEEGDPPVESASIEPPTKEDEAPPVQPQELTSIEPLLKEEEEDEAPPVQPPEPTSIEPLPKEEEEETTPVQPHEPVNVEPPEDGGVSKPTDVEQREEEATPAPVESPAKPSRPLTLEKPQIDINKRIRKLLLTDLRKVSRNLKLSHTGRKAQVINRICAHYKKHPELIEDELPI